MIFFGIKTHPVEWNIFPWITSVEDAWRFDWLFIFFGSSYMEDLDEQ